ncbi:MULTISPECIES: hypothetical protein [Actinosynnema]|uniref:hypothetical protein n=1 Tax=Actinosynnema TaxID=40566 RepID=UPI0020A3BA68|nr:hypothetical protein [Actinosynnema pretiosum]MCP2092467.1 hypothetical protein [Actinosynnema pretiosum]
MSGGTVKMALRNLVASGALGVALVAGAVLLPGVAVAQEECAEDTHWSADLAKCVDDDTHW